MSRPVLRAAGALVVLAALAPVLSKARGDEARDFKRDWDAASSVGDPTARAEKQLKALERIRGAQTVAAAQGALAASVDANVHWKVHAYAWDILLAMSSSAPVRAWAAAQVSQDKDPRNRAVLCALVAKFPAEEAVEAAKALAPVLKDKDPCVLAAAAAESVRVKRKEMVAALVAALALATEPRAEDDLVRALQKLTDRTMEEAVEWTAWWQAEGEKWNVGDPAPPRVLVPTGNLPVTTSDGSGLVEKIRSNHVAFLIDISYSMRITSEVAESKPNLDGSPPKKHSLSRLEFVQKELCAAIECQLKDTASFNVISFNSTVSPWKTKLVPATAANKQAAKAWVQALQPEGETDIYDALEAAYSDKTVDAIYLLTDGFPTNGKFVATDAICGEVRKWNATRRVRLHCLCYVAGDPKKFALKDDRDQSRKFMKTLADESGGTLRYFE